MRLTLLIISCLSLTGCDLDVTAGADEKFGDQNFKSAVALIELHKTRTGQYPLSLDEIEFLGDWDGIWLQAVDYERFEDGYKLYVVRGWVGEPSIELPAGFKTGLGLVDSNVTWIEDN
jgi:hypothetical protein